MSVTVILIGIVLSAVFSLFFIPLMIRVSHKYNIFDQPGKHKRHKKPTPFFGGVAMFIVTWLTVFILMAVQYEMFADFASSIVFILMGGLIILLVGLSDDLKPVSAWVKLLAQIGAGLVLYLGGLEINLLTTPFGSIDIGSFSIILTILWVVVLTNAINLIDGLDGLATGVSLIAAVTLLIIGQLYEVGAVLVFLMVLIGFLSVFLYYNSYPAKIFLGDSGSMQIGYYFAVFSLIFPVKSYTAAALYVPLLALGVPLLEVLSSFIRRLASGKNIMKADRRHLFHYLALLGLSPHRVVVVFYLLAIVYGAFALAMFFWNRVWVFGFLVFFMVVIFSIFYILVTKFKPEDYRRNLADKER